MGIRVSTESSGHNTDNELVIYVHPNGYGYGKISIDGSSDDLNLKICPKGEGQVEVTNLHITGLEGSVLDKLSSIESVLASVSISGTNITAVSISDKVVTLENEMDDVELSIEGLQTQVVALSGINSTYDGGDITNTISAITKKNNKIAFSFKVKEDKIVGVIPYEGLPDAQSVLGMSAYVESDGKEYYATEKGWIAIQAEGVYKTIKLTDDFISHSHYASIGPKDAVSLLFDEVEYVDIYSNEECVPVDHRHLVRWKKDSNGKIVGRLLFDNHPTTPHLLSEDEMGFDLLSTAVKNGLDETEVFQTCTLVEGISGSTHSHVASITVKQALELYKNQREWIRTETIQQSESNLGFYDIDAVQTATGNPTYSEHKHYVTWKYEAGQTGLIRQHHLGQFSTSETNTDELHKYTQYDIFGHIKPSSVSTNIPVEANNSHIHEISYTKSILNDIFTSLEVTKFNKTGGIIHGRVGIRDGFTYIDAETPTVSGSNYEMVLGTSSYITVSGAPVLSGGHNRTYWEHTDNHALRIGDDYVGILNNRNFGIGDFSFTKLTEADLHIKRDYSHTNVLIESKGGNVPSLELCSGTTEPSLSGATIGGKIFVNNSNELVFTGRPTGEVIFQNKLSDRGFSFASGNNTSVIITGDGDLEVQGNLIVWGEASIINSSETHISDNIIELNSISGSANLTGSSLQVGFAFKRGPDKEDYFLLYNEQTQSMVAGVSGVLNALPFHEGSIIEGAGIVYGSGIAGDNVDTYTQDANNFRYTIADGLYVDASGEVGINLNNNKIINVLDGVDNTDAINRGQLIAAIDAIIQDHGELEGNEDDDHLQYIRTDGQRDFAGIQSYNNDYSFNSPRQIPDKNYVDVKVTTVTNSINSHSLLTNNPHSVTIEQLGGTTFSQSVKFNNVNTSIKTDLQIMDSSNNNAAYITSTSKGNFSIWEGSGNTWFGTGSLLLGIATSTIDVNNKKIVNMSPGINGNDGATYSQVSSVAFSLDNHKINYNNPHSVTIEQLGGTTFSQQITIPDGSDPSHAVNKYQLDNSISTLTQSLNDNVSVINSTTNSLQSQITSNDTDITSLQSQITSNDTDIASHVGNTSNPHSVTIEQLGGTTFSQQITIPDGSDPSHAVNKYQLDNSISTLTQSLNDNVSVINSTTNSLQSQITSNDTDITSLQSQITNNDTDIASINTSSWEETIATHNGLTTVTIPNGKVWDQSKNTMLVFADGVKLSRGTDWTNNGTSTTTFNLMAEFSAGFNGEINIMRLL